MTLTAAHCAKTLILGSSAGNPTLRQCSRLLVPGLIEFVAKMAPLIHDGTVTEAMAAAISEVWKAFTALFSSTAEEYRKPSISLMFAFLNYMQQALNCLACSSLQFLSFFQTQLHSNLWLRH